MTRLLAMLIGVTGLVAALYLFLHRSASAVPGVKNCDGLLFGIVIAVLSILMLKTSLTQHEPDPGDSLSM